MSIREAVGICLVIVACVVALLILHRNGVL